MQLSQEGLRNEYYYNPIKKTLRALNSEEMSVLLSDSADPFFSSDCQISPLYSVILRILLTHNITVLGLQQKNKHMSNNFRRKTKAPRHLRDLKCHHLMLPFNCQIL